MPVEPWMIIALVVAILGIVIVLARMMENRRRARLEAIASELGFEFLQVLPGEVDSSRSRFQLFNTGRSRKGSNVLRRQVDDLTVLVFDYAYTTGSGKHQHRHAQSVVMFYTPQLSLTPFRLTPEGWLSRLGELFGAKDIAFDDDPEFSRAFRLSGVHEPDVRELFGPDQRAIMVQNRNFSVEAEGNCLVVWTQGRRVSPEETKVLFERAFELYSALKSAPAV